MFFFIIKALMFNISTGSLLKINLKHLYSMLIYSDINYIHKIASYNG